VPSLPCPLVIPGSSYGVSMLAWAIVGPQVTVTSLLVPSTPASALPYPAGRSGPWSRRTGAPKASATGRDRTPEAHEIAHGTRRDTPR
jgi:hypothetical protein